MTDRYLGEGVGRGAIGFILDVGSGGYIIEFSRSEDGTTIAFSGENTAEEPVVMVVTPGSTPTEVTGGEEPSWSPDGSEFAFVRLAE